MQSSPIQSSSKCIQLLFQPPQNFQRVEFLKNLFHVSNNQKFKKSSLFLYCMYCVLSKFDYVDGLQAIQKAQGADQGSVMSVAIGKMVRALLYTYIDKQFTISIDSQTQGFLNTLESSNDSISLEMKNHYKHMIPLIITNLNLTNGRKSFYKFFDQIYDELTKQSSSNQLNQEILFSIHQKIQYLKQHIDFIPTTINTNLSNNPNTLKKSLSANNFNKSLSEQNKLEFQESQYMGFAKPLTKEEKSVNNIRKMLQSQKSVKEKPVSIGNRKTGLGSTKNYLKNQPNPYQLNLYADEKPKCQFL